MLIATPTRFGAGLTIGGDWWDLRSLHETIHSIVGKWEVPERLGDFVLGFAYEIRHAYQRMRSELHLGVDDLDRVTYQAVDVLWPIVLFHVALLRWASSKMSTTKEEQANLFRLEHGIEQALHDVNAAAASPCIDWLNAFQGVSHDYLTLHVVLGAHQYVFGKPGGRRRIERLPAILKSFSESSPEYQKLRKDLQRRAAAENCSPHDFEDRSDWPRFRW